MPRNNCFQHQKYGGEISTSRVYYLTPPPPCPPGSPEFVERMRAAGDAMRRAGVAAIYLVHGTFLGADALGLLADLSRLAPDIANVLRRWQKQIVDAVAGEAGNFTQGYAAEFERALQGGEGPSIPVRLFHWSSENHHLGRADAAVRLIDELASRQFPPGSRVLLWGHSHSGNVFALLTNLLGSPLAARKEFFDCVRCFYHCPIFRWIDLPEWERAEQLICGPTPVLEGVQLDLVTFGTPVRYGWDSGGYATLTHFINHCPTPGEPPYRAKFPPTAAEVLHATTGDLVQQVGVAGTNFAPPFWEWRAWRADVRLGKLLQAGCSSGDLLARWRMGVRVHDEGDNLLVNYGPGGSSVAQHLFGHAVYTRREWLAFHATEVARRLCGLEPAPETLPTDPTRTEAPASSPPALSLPDALPGRDE